MIFDLKSSTVVGYLYTHATTKKNNPSKFSLINIIIKLNNQSLFVCLFQNLPAKWNEINKNHHMFRCIQHDKQIREKITALWIALKPKSFQFFSGYITYNFINMAKMKWNYPTDEDYFQCFFLCTFHWWFHRFCVMNIGRRTWWWWFIHSCCHFGKNNPLWWNRGTKQKWKKIV